MRARVSLALSFGGSCGVRGQSERSRGGNSVLAEPQKR